MSFECQKCKAWNRTAYENGFATGICGDCFDQQCVSVKLPYDPAKPHSFLQEEYEDSRLQDEKKEYRSSIGMG